MEQRKKPYFTIGFKQDAVQLVLSKGYSIQEAAANLGVSESALRRWIRSEKGGTTKGLGLSATQLSLSEHEELLRLRKENIKLKKYKVKNGARDFKKQPKDRILPCSIETYSEFFYTFPYQRERPSAYWWLYPVKKHGPGSTAYPALAAH